MLIIIKLSVKTLSLSVVTAITMVMIMMTDCLLLRAAKAMTLSPSATIINILMAKTFLMEATATILYWEVMEMTA